MRTLSSRPFICGAMFSVVAMIGTGTWIGAYVDDVEGSESVEREVGPEYVNSSLGPAVAERLENVAERLRATGETGFAEVSADVGVNTVDLWWKGDLGPQARKIVAKASEVNIVVHRAKYDRAELTGAAGKIRSYKPTVGSFKVTSVIEGSLERPTPEFGLIVSVAGVSDLADKQIEQQLAREAGVSVTVNHETTVQLSRQNDSSP